MVALAGCATPPPDIPRQTGKAREAGYTISTVSPQDSPVAITDNAPIKKIALIAAPVWWGLRTPERTEIELGHEVRIIGLDGFGTVIDVQGADQSTPSTKGGAALGSAVASAAYIDNAISGKSNYSASAHLALGLLGAAAGSSMDRTAVSQFQFRYTVKQNDGEIQYYDEIKSTSFRHSVGVCILVPSLILVSQHVCNQTVDSVRARYLRVAAVEIK